MSGLRLRRYDGPHLLQLSAAVNWIGEHGVLLGAHAGRQWQFGNWNVEGVAGLRFASAALVDFVSGIDADEATARFPVHEGSASTFAEARLALSRPLSRRWVFRTSAHVRRFDDALVDSPLVVSHGAATFESAFHYVF